MDKDKTLVTTCECSDPAHIMVFRMLPRDRTLIEGPALWVEVQLNPMYPWWKRLWVALAYVRGRRSRFSSGHWDEGTISPESAKSLVILLNHYIYEWQRYDLAQMPGMTPGTATAGTRLLR